MLFSVKGFITCKEAEGYRDCADHYAFNLQTHRFAIADGVTKSFFPKLWSRILVEKSVAQDGATDLPLEESQDEWLDQVTQRVSSPDVKWFTTNAFLRKEAALSTLVSLDFDEDNMVWTASAIGDSFLFFVPKDEEDNMDSWVKLSSKPEPVEFDNFPDYLSSRGEGKGEIQHACGNIVPGTFYLMTDALSEWVFTNQGNALRLIRKEWNDQKAYTASVEKLRHSEQLHDDDSAVLVIQVEDDGLSDICYKDVNVTSLEELVEMEKTLSQCRETIRAKRQELSNTIETLIQNSNLSEYAKQELEKQLSEEYAISHRDCDRNE